jgi:hypothetical protein
MNDDAKKIILARRARFIAAALAGVAVQSQACGESNPEVCLGLDAGGTAAGGTQMGGSAGTGIGGYSGTIDLEPPDGFGGIDGEGGEGFGGAPAPCLPLR